MHNRINVIIILNSIALSICGYRGPLGLTLPLNIISTTASELAPWIKGALHILESVSLHLLHCLCTFFLSKLTSFPPSDWMTFERATFWPSDTIFLCLSIFDVHTAFILENSDLLWIIPLPYFWLFNYYCIVIYVSNQIWTQVTEGKTLLTFRHRPVQQPPMLKPNNFKDKLQ